MENGKGRVVPHEGTQFGTREGLTKAYTRAFGKRSSTSCLTLSFRTHAVSRITYACLTLNSNHA